MSDRDLIVPGTALAQTTKRINDQLRQINQRIRWNGTTADEVGTDVTIVPTSTPLNRQYREVQRLTLDEGVWLALASTTVDNSGPWSFGPYNELAVIGYLLNYDGSPPSPGSFDSGLSYVTGRAGSTYLASFSLNATSKLVLERRTDVIFRVSVAIPGAVGGWRATKTRMTVAPG
jgi:hypothetical protein